MEQQNVIDISQANVLFLNPDGTSIATVDVNKTLMHSNNQPLLLDEPFREGTATECDPLKQLIKTWNLDDQIYLLLKGITKISNFKILKY